MKKAMCVASFMVLAGLAGAFSVSDDLLEFTESGCRMLQVESNVSGSYRVILYGRDYANGVRTYKIFEAYPTHFDLAADERKDVSVCLRMPDNIPAGEYTADLKVEDTVSSTSERADLKVSVSKTDSFVDASIRDFREWAYDKQYLGVRNITFALLLLLFVPLVVLWLIR